MWSHLLIIAAAQAAPAPDTVVIPPGAALYMAPSPDAAGGTLGPPIADPAERVQAARRAVLVAQVGDFVHVRTTPTRAGMCSTALAAWPLALDLYVRTDELQPMVAKAHTVSGGGKTQLQIRASVPAVADDQGRLHLASHDMRAVVPAAGIALSTMARRGPALPNGGHDGGVHEALHITAENGAFSADVDTEPLGWAVGVHRREKERTLINAENSCLFVTGWTTAAVTDERTGGGLLGSLGPARDKPGWEVPPDTALTWVDGSPAGQTLSKWWFAAEAAQDLDGRLCAPVGMGDPARLRACAPAHTVTATEPAASAHRAFAPKAPRTLPPRSAPPKPSLGDLKLHPITVQTLAQDLGPMPASPTSAQLSAALSKGLVAKAQALQTAQQTLQAGGPPRDPAAKGALMLEMGLLYEDMAAQLLDLPAPADLSPEAATIYRETLADQAHPLCAKAAALYKLGVEEGPGTPSEPANRAGLDRLGGPDQTEDGRWTACFSAVDW